MAPSDLPRLATLVKQRRLGLRLARKAAADAAGVSKDTWRRVEEGEPVREMSYAKIEPILKWTPGSCLAILAGGEPELLNEPSAGPEVQTQPDAGPQPSEVHQLIREQMPDGKILAMEYEYVPSTGGRTYRFAVAPSDATPEDEQRIKDAFRAAQPAPPRSEDRRDPDGDGND
jgi:hypothetical protein